MLLNRKFRESLYIKQLRQKHFLFRYRKLNLKQKDFINIYLISVLILSLQTTPYIFLTGLALWLTKTIIKKTIAFFKAIDWKIFKLDIIRLLGRTYYLRMTIYMALIDIFVLVKIFFNTRYILLTIPLTIISIKVYINFLSNLVFIALNKHYKTQIVQAPRAQCSSGAPGAGKSSNEAWKCVELAKWQWKRLQEEYWFYMALDRNKLSKEKQEDYDEVISAYNFEINSKNKIPCLWSNISIFDSNNKKLCSHKLTKAHLLQKKRLPYRAVLFVDEIGSTFPATKGPTSSELESLSKLARWIRQFLEAFWTFTEQEFSKAFVDVRRVTGSNRYFKGQIWVLKPHFLIGIYKSILELLLFPIKMKRLFKPNSKQYLKYEKAAKRNSKIFSKPMKLFKKYINSIGWRHYTYVELGNSEVNVKNQDYDNKKGDGKTRHIYLQSCLNCYYDDRAFKNAYEAIEYDLLESEFKGSKLSKEDIKELFEKND